MAAHTATHTVALANMVVNNENHGLHWFIVPLRDRKTGHLLPGVNAGDLGAKAGRAGLDNGWIQFTKVRVPHCNLLSRWIDVVKSGNSVSVVQKGKPALSYITLIKERLWGFGLCSTNLAVPATIAVRYSCVRRQGPSNEKIMDYQTQFMRLMPAVASVYVMQITHL